MTENSAGDYPQITAATYGSSTGLTWYGDLEENINMDVPDVLDGYTHGIMAKRRISQVPNTFYDQQLQAALNPYQKILGQQQQTIEQERQTMDKTKRRIVQVFIADPDPDVPLENALLYKGDAKFTDATDQELYFELQLADILKKHNELRVTWLDKEATKSKGKDVYLEPIKIRSLRMAVVTIAEF